MNLLTLGHDSQPGRAAGRQLPARISSARLIPYLAIAVAAAGCRAPLAAPTEIPTLVPTSTQAAPSPAPATATPEPTPLSPPETGQIVYVCQPSGDMRFDQICLINPDGSGQRQLTNNPEADQFYPSLAPDGQSVVFSANLDGPDDIYEMALNGAPQRLTRQGKAYAPTISPDGHQIAYTQFSGETPSIWLMNRDGSDAHLLITQSWDPAWSPDGRWILHASDRSGSIQLWRVHTDGTQLEPLTAMDGLRGRSDWSPAGDWVATYAGQPWLREIYRIRLDDGRTEQLTAGGNNLAPSFSPDGNWIVFTSYRDHYGDDNGCEIYLMHLQSRTVFRLTDNDTCDWQPRWGK